MVTQHAVRLAQDVYGCRVLNVCLEHFPIHAVDELIQALMRSLPALVDHK